MLQENSQALHGSRLETHAHPRARRDALSCSPPHQSPSPSTPHEFNPTTIQVKANRAMLRSVMNLRSRNSRIVFTLSWMLSILLIGQTATAIPRTSPNARPAKPRAAVVLPEAGSTYFDPANNL